MCLFVTKNHHFPLPVLALEARSEPAVGQLWPSDDDDDGDDDGEHDDSGGDCDGQAFKGFTAQCLLSRAKLLLIRTLSNNSSSLPTRSLSEIDDDDDMMMMMMMVMMMTI